MTTPSAAASPLLVHDVAPDGRFLIDPRFRGPNSSANGGYVAGLFAERIGGCEVTLVAPPPLDAELEMAREDDRLALRVAATGKALAYAKETELSDPPPAPISFARATVASAHFHGFERHPLPQCFVCGTARAPGDALHIYCGRERGADIGPVYGTWQPDRSLAVPMSEQVATRFLVAALDCPGGWASLGSRELTMLLGRMSFRVIGSLRVGERCVVVGASRGRDGRKHYADSAIYGENGNLVAHSQQIWIEVDPRSV